MKKTSDLNLINIPKSLAQIYEKSTKVRIFVSFFTHHIKDITANKLFPDNGKETDR